MPTKSIKIRPGFPIDTAETSLDSFHNWFGHFFENLNKELEFPHASTMNQTWYVAYLGIP